MRSRRVLVINPNSNDQVTAGLVRSLDCFAIPGKLEIDCLTLRRGPHGIETDEHIAAVVEPLKNTITAHGGIDAYIIACYSDPGLDVCRRVTDRPVLGIQRSALALACSLRKKFGVLAISDRSMGRHLAYIEKLGLTPLLAGERALGISVDESVNGRDIMIRLRETGELLVGQDRAELVILGCAGLAAHRAPLEQLLGVPVIDPVQAAVGQAMGLILL